MSEFSTGAPSRRCAGASGCTVEHASSDAGEFPLGCGAAAAEGWLACDDLHSKAYVCADDCSGQPIGSAADDGGVHQLNRPH